MEKDEEYWRRTESARDRRRVVEAQGRRLVNDYANLSLVDRPLR